MLEKNFEFTSVSEWKNFRRQMHSKYLVSDQNIYLYKKARLIFKKTLQFVYSEKTTKFCKISTLFLSTVHTDKSEVEISQNFVAFSEYMNFSYHLMQQQKLYFLDKNSHLRFTTLMQAFSFRRQSSAQSIFHELGYIKALPGEINQLQLQYVRMVFYYIFRKYKLGPTRLK